MAYLQGGWGPTEVTRVEKETQVSGLIHGLQPAKYVLDIYGIHSFSMVTFMNWEHD